MSRDAINLNAVYWNSVGMMRGQYLTEDREFVLDQLRLQTFAQNLYGIVSMPANALNLLPHQDSQGSVGEYTLELRECRAITPNGYLVEIVPDAGAQICAPYVGKLSPQAGGSASAIAIYLGIRQEREPVGETSSQGRSQRRFAQSRYLLSTTRREQDIEDWLCIGKIISGGTVLREESAFIPECLRLNSMPRLRTAVELIQERAESCIALLDKQLSNRRAEAASMAAALTEAAVVLDWNERPRAYLNRVFRILRQLHELRVLLPHPGLHQQIEEHLRAALKDIPPEVEQQEADWGYLLRMAADALQNLAKAYGNWGADIGPSVTPGGDVRLKEEPIQEAPGSRQQNSKQTGTNWFGKLKNHE